MFGVCAPRCLSCPAFWDATRAFMLLAVLSCFAGVVLGLSAFTNGTKNRRVRTGGIALLLSGNTPGAPSSATETSASSILGSLMTFSRFSRPSGAGDLHRGDRHFFWKTLLGLAFFLVLHYWLGGHHIGFRCRYFFILF